MKKNILLIAGIMMAFMAKGQGTLQFNLVKLVGAGTETVPTGKVWKVVSVLTTSAINPNAPSTNTTTTTSKTIAMNGSTIVIARAQNVGNTGNGYAAASFGQVTEMPFWIPAGTTIATSTNSLFISVIEFNIVP